MTLNDKYVVTYVTKQRTGGFKEPLRYFFFVIFQTHLTVCVMICLQQLFYTCKAKDKRFND